MEDGHHPPTPGGQRSRQGKFIYMAALQKQNDRLEIKEERQSELKDGNIWCKQSNSVQRLTVMAA